MINKVQEFSEQYKKTDLPEIRPGQQIRVSQRIKEGDKERVAVFEGQVLARKHGKEAGATITLRRLAGGMNIEMVLPLHSPSIEKIEILRKVTVKRAKLYYLREAKGKRAKLKEEEKKK